MHWMQELSCYGTEDKICAKISKKNDKEKYPNRTEKQKVKK